MDIYDDAVLVIAPGRNALRKAGLRRAFEAITVCFKNGLQIEQNRLEVLDARDTALC